MSDNPLADWLGAHQGGDDAGAGEEQRPAEGASATWPDWAGSATPRAPEAAPWAQPPDEDTDSGSSRRRLLLMAAAVPWAVACALGVAVVTGGPSPVTEESAAPVADAGRPAEPDEPAVQPALGAAAALAVRLAVTTAAEEDPGAVRRYVDLTVPEAMSWVGDVAIVTVAAVVLEGAGDQWHTSRPARFAVPLQLVDGRAVAVGEPWPLATDAPTAHEPGWEPTDVADDSVAHALAAAGYTDVEAIDVEAREASSSPEEAALWRVQVRARAPGESEPRAHQLWLRTDPEPSVLGADR